MKTLALAVAVTLFVVGEAQGYGNTCGNHQTYNGNQCACKKGYMRVKGVCSRCPSDSKYSCKYNICKCNYGKTYDIATNTCKKDDYQSTTTTPTTTYTPPTKPTSSSTTRAKIPDSYCMGQNYRLPKGGPYGPGGKCPKMSYWSAEFPCTCNWGLGWYNYDCVPDCGVNEVPTPGGGCTCKSGYNRYDGVKCTYCPPRSYWENGSCYCEWGLVEKDGKCVEPYSNSY